MPSTLSLETEVPKVSYLFPPNTEDTGEPLDFDYPEDYEDLMDLPYSSWPYDALVDHYDFLIENDQAPPADLVMILASHGVLTMNNN